MRKCERGTLFFHFPAGFFKARLKASVDKYFKITFLVRKQLPQMTNVVLINVKVTIASRFEAYRSDNNSPRVQTFVNIILYFHGDITPVTVEGASQWLVTFKAR